MRQGQYPFSGTTRPSGGGVIFGEEFESGRGSWTGGFPGFPPPRGFGLQDLPAQLTRWNPANEPPENVLSPFLDPLKQIGACFSPTPQLGTWDWGGAIARIKFPALRRFEEEGDPEDAILFAGFDVLGRCTFPQLPLSPRNSLIALDGEYRNGMIFSTEDLIANPAAPFHSLGTSRRVIGGELTSFVYYAKWLDFRNVFEIQQLACSCEEPIVRIFGYTIAPVDEPENVDTFGFAMFSEDGGLGWKVLDSFGQEGKPQTIGFGCTGKMEPSEPGPAFANPCTGGAEFLRMFNVTPSGGNEEDLEALLQYTLITGRCPDGGRNWPGGG